MIQLYAKAIGEGGCYLLCILKKFGKEWDALRFYKQALDAKWSDSDCYLNNPDLVAQAASGRKWRVSHQGPNYVLKSGEWAVQRWERSTVAGKMSHFTLPDWDPLGESQTRLHGQLVSLRVFSPA